MLLARCDSDRVARIRAPPTRSLPGPVLTRRAAAAPLETRVPPQGTTVINATATDAAGNVGFQIASVVLADLTKPVVTVMSSKCEELEIDNVSGPWL